MDDSFARFGAAMVRFRWVVLAIWILLIPISGGLGASKASAVLKGGGFFRAGSESDQVTTVLARDFNAADSNNALVVFRSDSQTSDDPGFQTSVNDAATRLKAVTGVQAITNFYETHDNRLVSADKHTMILIVSLSGDENQASSRVPALREALDPVTLDHQVAGAPAVNYDLEETINEDLHRAEYLTIPVVIILLLFVFRTVIAAAIPMLLGLCAVVTAIAILYVIGRQTTLSIFALNTASMLGLGLGIDFSLIVVSRYREELAAGRDTKSAVAMTMATAGRSITYSGLTVMIGMLVLTLMLDIRLVRSMALSILLVALTALAGGLTLMPAVLGILGRRIDWLPILPKPKPPKPGQVGFWYRLSHAIMRHPWMWLGVSLLLLLGLAIPAKDLKMYGANVHVVPEETGAVQGFNILSDAFGANRLSLIQVVVQTGKQDGVWDPDTLEALAQLQDKIKADSRVEDVSSLFSLTTDVPRDQVRTITKDKFSSNPALAGALTQYVNSGGRSDIAVFTITAKTDQFADDHQAFVKDLRSTIIPSVSGLSSYNTKVGGLAATFLDLRDGIYSRFPLIIGTVMALTFILLMMFFQSIFLPLKAILMNVASILATYGALVLIFQRGFGLQVYGVDPIGSLSVVTPVILFVILFGLSTDYEVFMLSRVKEFFHETGNNEEAVATGLESTARVITAAGLILIGTFGSFSLSRVISLKETGLGLAIGVLIDSTIVRIIMVPATMRLAGNANWYMPAWLKKIVPELKEGPSAAPAHAPSPAFAYASAAPPPPPMAALGAPPQPSFAPQQAPPAFGLPQQVQPSFGAQQAAPMAGAPQLPPLRAPQQGPPPTFAPQQGQPALGGPQLPPLGAPQSPPVAAQPTFAQPSLAPPSFAQPAPAQPSFAQQQGGVPPAGMPGRGPIQLPQTPMVGRLRPRDGGMGTEEIPLPRRAPFRIGRDKDAELWLYSSNISRQHARIDYDGKLNSFIITDLGSMNGVYVNGQRIDTPTILRDGDQIEIGSSGQVRLVFDTRPDPWEGAAVR